MADLAQGDADLLDLLGQVCAAAAAAEWFDVRARALLPERDHQAVRARCEHDAFV